jgi:hypothetical protein
MMTVTQPEASVMPGFGDGHVHEIHLERGLLIQDCLECRAIVFQMCAANPTLNPNVRKITLTADDPILKCPACRLAMVRA